MNTDIRLSVTALDHWKLADLSARLGDRAIVCLLRLWGFTAVNKPNGVLDGLSAQTIERMARWKGASGRLVATLLDLRLLDQVGETYSVHDWVEHQPYVIHGPDRKARAKKAAEVRWANEMHAKGMLPADKEHARRYAPSPSPSPDPYPSPARRMDGDVSHPDGFKVGTPIRR